MFFFLSKLFDVFLSPYTWGLALFVASVPWWANRERGVGIGVERSFRRRRVCGVLGLLVLLLASSLPVANALLWGLEHQAVSTYRPEVTYDAVVLLGGVVDEEVSAVSGQPSYNDNVERVIMTARLLRGGKARFVIVSGATENPNYQAFSETALLGRQLEEWGVASERIVFDNRAWNTRENAVNTKQIANERGFATLLLVTSAFHMPRAAECFAAVGMNVDLMPVDYRGHEHRRKMADWLPRASALAVTTSMTREWFGRLVYRAQGYGKSVR